MGRQALEEDFHNLSFACKDFHTGFVEEIFSLWRDGKMIPQEALSACKMVEIGEVEL